MDEPYSIVEGFAYSVLLDSDGERRTALDAVLIGKDVKRDDNGKLVVVERLKNSDLEEFGLDLDAGDLADFFDMGESSIPSEIASML